MSRTRKGGRMQEEPTMLLRRYRAADQAVDWQDREVLGGLAEVMAVARRIASVESSHYRATNVLELVQGALTVRTEVFSHFADSVAADVASNEMDATPIGELSRMIEAIEVLLTSVMWSKTWDEPICHTQATALCEAIAALTDWAQHMQAAALGDHRELR